MLNFTKFNKHSILKEEFFIIEDEDLLYPDDLKKIKLKECQII